MKFWMLRAKKIILTTIISELALFSLIFIVFPINKTLTFSWIHLFDIFCISTFLFYISGKYHDLSFISKSKIIKNFFKVMTIMFITIIFSEFLSLTEYTLISSFNDFILIIFYIILININQIIINKYFQNSHVKKKIWIIYKDKLFVGSMGDNVDQGDLTLYIYELDKHRFVQYRQYITTPYSFQISIPFDFISHPTYGKA